MPEIFYSKSRARLRHAMALNNCKQLQEWIHYNYSYKTSLLNISKICTDLSVASSLHGNKITADKDHHWNDGMAYFKTHVELMPIRCTD